MNDRLGDRMKGYEAVARHSLLRRCPVIVRVDGRAFHTWTRSLEKPFDDCLRHLMQAATVTLAEEMQGCKLAYTQSDEASFLLLDTDTLETQPWFGYDGWKVVSLAASTMTAAFERGARHAFAEERPLATFDARAFNVPDAEVANYFLWRAKDWRRNSVQALAQAHFSPKQLHGKDQAAMLAMLEERGISWSALPSRFRCGTFYVCRTGERITTAEPTYDSISGVLSCIHPPDSHPAL